MSAVMIVCIGNHAVRLAIIRQWQRPSRFRSNKVTELRCGPFVLSWGAP